jgi:hypothetical protein
MRDLIGKWLEGVSIKEHIDSEIAHVNRAIEREVAHIGETARAQAEGVARETAQRIEAMEVRLGLLNEFREMVEKWSESYLSKAAFDAFREATVSKLSELHDFRTTQEAKASQLSVIVIGIISVTGLIGSIVALVRHW